MSLLNIVANQVARSLQVAQFLLQRLDVALMQLDTVLQGLEAIEILLVVAFAAFADGFLLGQRALCPVEAPAFRG